MALLEFSESLLFISAAILFVTGLLIACVQLKTKGQYPQKLIYLTLLFGFILQSIALNIRSIFVEGCPLGNPFEVIQFIVWSLVALFLLVGPIFKLKSLGLFTAFLVSIASIVSLIIPSLDAQYYQTKQTTHALIELHASLAIFSYAVYSLLAILSLMFLIQQYGLKKQLFKGIFRHLPSINKLDRCVTYLIWIGTFILLLALIFGSLFWLDNPDTVPRLKLISTIAIFIAYIIVGALKSQNLISPRRQATLSIVLFILSIASLWIIEISRPDAVQSVDSVEQISEE